MANPDPLPNSLGLDIVQSEPTPDAQSTLAEPPLPSPQPTTQSFAETTDSVATDTVSSPTTPVTVTDNIDKVEDETKPDVSKKTPYVNPERVKTGGLPRVNLVSLYIGATRFTVSWCCSGQVDRRGARRKNDSNERAK